MSKTNGDVVASDGRPLDHQDDASVWWIMAACGHRVGGAVKPGDKILLCPNCRWLARFQSIKVVYPERMPESLEQTLGGVQA